MNPDTVARKPGVFPTLKGWQRTAQGTALGTDSGSLGPALKGRNRIVSHGLLADCFALSGLGIIGSVSGPRAAPLGFPVSPFQGTEQPGFPATNTEFLARACRVVSRCGAARGSGGRGAGHGRCPCARCGSLRRGSRRSDDGRRPRAGPPVGRQAGRRRGHAGHDHGPQRLERCAEERRRRRN